ncbi:hypothetical protein LINPERPRIM_LOCUS15132 [Linum perenne]
MPARTTLGAPMTSSCSAAATSAAPSSPSRSTAFLPLTTPIPLRLLTFSKVRPAALGR